MRAVLDHPSQSGVCLSVSARRASAAISLTAILFALAIAPRTEAGSPHDFCRTAMGEAVANPTLGPNDGPSASVMPVADAAIVRETSLARVAVSVPRPLSELETELSRRFALYDPRTMKAQRGYAATGEAFVVVEVPREGFALFDSQSLAPVAVERTLLGRVRALLARELPVDLILDDGRKLFLAWLKKGGNLDAHYLDINGRPALHLGNRVQNDSIGRPLSSMLELSLSPSSLGEIGPVEVRDLKGIARRLPGAHRGIDASALRAFRGFDRRNGRAYLVLIEDVPVAVLEARYWLLEPDGSRLRARVEPNTVISIAPGLAIRRTLDVLSDDEAKHELYQGTGFVTKLESSIES